MYMLKCNITGEVNHLAEGLKLGLNDDREKTSEQLGRQVALGRVRDKGREERWRRGARG